MTQNIRLCSLHGPVKSNIHSLLVSTINSSSDSASSSLSSQSVSGYGSKSYFSPSVMRRPKKGVVSYDRGTAISLERTGILEIGLTTTSALRWPPHGNRHSHRNRQISVNSNFLQKYQRSGPGSVKNISPFPRATLAASIDTSLSSTGGGGGDTSYLVF